MNSASEAKAKQAREQLDAQVREMIEWHFNPATGCPFWLEKAKGGSSTRARRCRTSTI